jgi:hypothetical protein
MIECACEAVCLETIDRPTDDVCDLPLHELPDRRTNILTSDPLLLPL